MRYIVVCSAECVLKCELLFSTSGGNLIELHNSVSIPLYSLQCNATKNGVFVVIVCFTHLILACDLNAIGRLWP